MIDNKDTKTMIFKFKNFLESLKEAAEKENKQLEAQLGVY